jgi:hypothetical protein
MSLPAFPQNAPNGGCGFAVEVTRLNCDGQFKPFVYLNGRQTEPAGSSPGATSSDTQKSRLAAGPSCFRSNSGFELTAALTLLVRFLALSVRILLPVRILLLLPGLLAATLLLSGFLARVLVLLARVLVLVRHFGISLVERNPK